MTSMAYPARIRSHRRFTGVTALAFAACTLSCAACATTRPSPPPAATPTSEAQATPPVAPGTAIDPEASDYPYPFPVHMLDLRSQGLNLRMAYLDVPPANANGRCVVLLHGKNFSAFYWKRTIEALNEHGFRVIAPDQIGFGKSSKPGNYQYSFSQLAHHTRALLESLSLQRCSVVGHSMGGMLAVRFALQHPAMTERLVLVNPIGLEDYASTLPYRTIDEWYADELKQTPDTVREYQRTAYYSGVWKPEYEELIRLGAGFTLHPDYARVAWVSALTYDMIITQPVVNDLPRLRVPTGLIIGTRDRTAVGKKFALPQTAATMGNYEVLGERARDAIPGAQLVELPGVGHVPQVESFQLYSDALIGFLTTAER